ncbi:uncharacterized protein [Epargyreus clarus]|uniref:uncharacterized protein n=1 Tax=Epargyreus clarus TaxID=520877 RepID=UPI003C2ABC6B
MLHNSDQFGASEPPINMGASVNMSMNGMNANGYGKTHDENPNAHYNLGNYTGYGHTVMSPHTSMHPFQNYSNVFQTSFMGHNPPMHDNWQHGLLPMNLNQTDNHNNFYERKDYLNDYKDQSLQRRSVPVPLNVPHVYPKPYKDPQMSYHYQEPSTKHYLDTNLDLSMNKTPKLDESRRRSLENTVKMIENILIHNPTSSTKYGPCVPSKPDIAPPIDNYGLVMPPKTDTISPIDKYGPTIPKQNTLPPIETENRTHETYVEPQKTPDNENIDSKNEENSKSVYSCSNENSVESETNSDEKNNNLTITLEPDNSSNNDDSQLQVEKIEIKVELHPNDSESENEDVKPLNMFKCLKNPLDMLTGNKNDGDNEVEVKVEEVSNWADYENHNPFQRDVFGVAQTAPNGTIVEATTSVSVAKDAIKNDTDWTCITTFYECPSCNLFFVNPKRFLVHTKWHSFGLTNEKRKEEEEEMLKERLTKRNKRKEARQLKKLELEEVKDDNVLGNVFKCNCCEKVFSTRASLKNHKQRYHAARIIDCRICHKSLAGWVAMRAHMATHTSDSRYQCSDCPKRFKYSHSLVKHRDTHLEKTHACEQCPKMFGSQALLNTHMKTHERFQRGMTFHCTYCGKGFFESYNLQVHERTHRNERPFLCDICNTSFGTNSSLQRHLRVSHNSSKPYQCSTCHRNFISEKIRERHVMRHHGDAEQFKFHCTHCPCRYLNLKDLNKHVHKNHPRPGRKKRSRKNKDESGEDE